MFVVIEFPVRRPSLNSVLCIVKQEQSETATLTPLRPNK